ncbi:DUF4124 domain-containing protein [Oryzomonas sagensis]|uniref:DUF4124 domain-containing protein n=2 Tax=Oryzomonas sagensis TaxID=2603857 RepID=A0ABQ6TSC8_9BACT|nr:DUF4124 domain-containing protein [Oryzomonas sagensis]
MSSIGASCASDAASTPCLSVAMKGCYNRNRDVYASECSRCRRFAMKIVAMAAIALCCTVAGGNAQTYRWIDDQGVVNFTDSLEAVPAKYRHKVLKGPDITTRDPRIKEEIQQQEERARQEDASRPPVTTTPDYVPPPMEIAPPKVESDELPPGRTRSQKILDNIERRKAEEEKAQQSGSQQ